VSVVRFRPWAPSSFPCDHRSSKESTVAVPAVSAMDMGLSFRATANISVSDQPTTP
jgi:hypothetical protein